MTIRGTIYQNQKYLQSGDSFTFPEGVHKFSIAPDSNATAIMKSVGDNLLINGDETYEHESITPISPIIIEAQGGDVRIVYFT